MSVRVMAKPFRLTERFERRSCLEKRRYSIEPSVTLDMYAYPCKFCQGWHKARKHEAQPPGGAR